MKSIIIAVFLSIHFQIYAQTDSSGLKQFIAGNMRGAIASSHNYEDCPKFETSLFATVIFFGDSGEIEKIIFSETENCFTENKEAISELLKIRFNNIKSYPAYQKELENSYVVLINYVLGNKEDSSKRFEYSLSHWKSFLQERAEMGLHETIPENWLNLFDGIDFSMFLGKKLKFILPVEQWYFRKVD
jgi:hypothetical protein